MSTAPTDQEIVDAIRSGVPTEVNAAVRYLYEHCKTYVTSFVYTDSQRQLLGLSDTYVNDLFQDTIEVFLKNVWTGKYEPFQGANLKTYLYGVSKNLYRSERKKTLRRLGRDHDFQEDYEDQLTPAETLLEKERYSLADQIFSKLSQAERELIQLFDFENKSHREIGELLGISEQAAKQRYYRSRLQIAAILKDYGTSH